MKIGAFGEVMLRLTPPEYLLLEQTNNLRMEFTGTGVNLLSNLGHLGQEVSLMTKLPANRLGQAAAANLKKLGIATDYVGYSGDHLGSFFAEVGYGPRATQVTYQNRRNSAFSLAAATDYDLSAFVSEMDLIHICGISLSLTEKTAATAQALAETAAAAGKLVCFDFNFRPSLNDGAGQRELMKQRYLAILPFVDLVFGSTRDLVELLGFGETPATTAEAEELIQAFLKTYQIRWFAGTKRGHDEKGSLLTGLLYTEAESCTSQTYSLQVLDRIGAGDAFAAGILWGIAQEKTLAQTVSFACANAVLAHTIAGDVPLTTEKMVQHFMSAPQVDLLR